MNRPYTICHILSALDGKISGAFMGTKAVQKISGEYARIRTEYQADAWLYGTVSICADAAKTSLVQRGNDKRL